MKQIGPIEWFMTNDHCRLDALLARADAGGAIDAPAFDLFRRGLLRHIAMEEKVLIRYARDRGVALALAPRLHADHGRIARLLVPTPTHAICEELRALLTAHNPLEEGDSGLYATCDSLAGDEGVAIVERLRTMPDVPVAPHYDGPLVRRQ